MWPPAGMQCILCWCTLSSEGLLIQVEPAIIGGLIIDVGEKHVDMSILTRVKKIEQVLRESV